MFTPHESKFKNTKKKDQKRVGIIENEGGPCVPDPVVAERERGAKEDPGLGFSERERKKRLIMMLR